MNIPIIKRAHKLSIINALKKKRLAEPLYSEYIKNSKVELAVTYAIAGFDIELTYFRYHGAVHGLKVESNSITDPLFVVSKLEGIIIGSILDDDDSAMSYEERVAAQMASTAHVQLPSTFAIINTLPHYLIPSMETGITTNPLIEIDNPLKYIEIINIEHLKLDLDKLRAEIKKIEPDWMARSPFFKRGGLTERVHDKYVKK